ncbi:hypothetical protein O59_000372 [Cellvibrio sp. BR]|nr:hypothetical protein O59_000372 [Cellvibrio sp. BR]
MRTDSGVHQLLCNCLTNYAAFFILLSVFSTKIIHFRRR